MIIYSTSKRMLAGMFLCSQTLMSCGINHSLNKQNLDTIEAAYSHPSLYTNPSIKGVPLQGKAPIEKGTEIQQKAESNQQLVLQPLPHESLVEEKEAINFTAVQTISPTQHPYIGIIRQGQPKLLCMEASELMNNPITTVPLKPLQPDSGHKPNFLFQFPTSNIKTDYKQKEGEFDHTQTNTEVYPSQIPPVQASHNETSTIPYGTDKLGDFGIFPRELLRIIFNYVGLKAMGELRLLNRPFYKLMTGYEKPGLLGIQYQHQAISLHAEICRGREVIEKGEFKRFDKEITLKNIPSVPFSQLIRGIRTLPESFWPYLKGTNVHTLDLGGNQIGDLGVERLGQALQGTNVQVLCLDNTQLGAKGAERLGKALQDTNVHTLNLCDNRIGAQGAEMLGQALQGTKVHTLYLNNNQIGDKGAEMLGQALKGTNVHMLVLFGNQIGDKGAEMLGQALQGTKVHTLNLSYNRIGAQGAEMLGKPLQGTKVHTLNLSYNQIGAQGAEMLGKTLQGTKVHTLYLNGNQIGTKGAEMLRKALQGTNFIKYISLD